MAIWPHLHEDLSRAHPVREASDRAFGGLFAFVFVLIGLLPLLKGGAAKLLPLGVGVAFGTVALVAPGILRPAKRAWLRLAALLHKVTSPIVLALLYYGAVVPTALLARASGRRPLSLGLDRSATTYWIRRDGDTAPGSMSKPF